MHIIGFMAHAMILLTTQLKRKTEESSFNSSDSKKMVLRPNNRPLRFTFSDSDISNYREQQKMEQLLKAADTQEVKPNNAKECAKYELKMPPFKPKKESTDEDCFHPELDSVFHD